LNKPYIWLREHKCADHLPDISLALTEPDGLLAIGGELNPDRLLDAYRKGIFPWYSEGTKGLARARMSQAAKDLVDEGVPLTPGQATGGIADT